MSQAADEDSERRSEHAVPLFVEVKKGGEEGASHGRDHSQVRVQEAKPMGDQKGRALQKCETKGRHSECSGERA